MRIPEQMLPSYPIIIKKKKKSIPLTDQQLYFHIAAVSKKCTEILQDATEQNKNVLDQSLIQEAYQQNRRGHHDYSLPQR